MKNFSIELVTPYKVSLAWMQGNVWKLFHPNQTLIPPTSGQKHNVFPSFLIRKFWITTNLVWLISNLDFFFLTTKNCSKPANHFWYYTLTTIRGSYVNVKMTRCLLFSAKKHFTLQNSACTPLPLPKTCQWLNAER